MSVWLTTKRVARYGLIGFIRNGFVSLAAVLIMTITLLVLGVLMVVGAGAQATLAGLQEKVDITVYFTTTAADDQIQQLQSSIKALPEVANVNFVSREAALAAFQLRHKNDQLTMQALEELGENPLGASLEIRAKDPSQYESIAKFLDSQQNTPLGTAIDKVNFFQNKAAIDKLAEIIAVSRTIGLVIAVVLGTASLLIAFNTIRLAIYTARDEIGVMNLVGASNWYIRGPFMIAGILYGVISGFLVLLILYPILLWLGPGSEQFLGNFNTATYFTSNFPMFFLIIMGSGIGLGALSSFLAVRRYLRG
jgi:cell division transport system permease protein